MRCPLALAFLLVPMAALAQDKPSAIEDCELIKEPHAYNACLASFGPRRNGDGPQVTAVPTETDTKTTRGPANSGKVVRGRDGRARAEFRVGGKDAVKTPKRTSRRAPRR